ncbi:MAG: hypothetical protein WCO63_05140 [Bacteroidota bacterium]
MAKHVLSKSSFIRGLQCHKSLYLNKYHQEVKDPLSLEQQQAFKRGHNVGDLAQNLFPGGVMAKDEKFFQVNKVIAQTKALIEQGVTIIYEAGFEYDACIALMDILVKDKSGWKAYEVKSSLEVKDVYRMDAAFQYYIITNSGIALQDIQIIFPKRMYDPKKPEAVDGYFQSESVMGFALSKQESIKKEVLHQKMVLTTRRLPFIPMGAHCDKPYPCDFKGFCRKDR